MIDRYALLPGERTISCTVHHSLLSGDKITAWFQAEAGRQYITTDVINKKARTWAMVILDKQTKEVVSDTKHQGKKLKEAE